MIGVQNRRRRRRVIGVAGVLCVSVALGGCDADPSTPSAPVAVDGAGTPPADNDGFAYLTEGSAADEYRQVTSEIEQPLPQGENFPPGLPENFLPADGYLEQGAADGTHHVELVHNEPFDIIFAANTREFVPRTRHSTAAGPPQTDEEPTVAGGLFVNLPSDVLLTRLSA